MSTTAVGANTREATAVPVTTDLPSMVLHLLGFQLSPGSELPPPPPPQLPQAELHTSRSFLAADTQCVVHATFQSAASKLSSYSQKREGDDASLPAGRETSWVCHRACSPPQTGSGVRSHQQTTDQWFCQEASGKGHTGEEASLRGNDSCGDHSTHESAKIQAAATTTTTTTAPPSTEATTTAPPPPTEEAAEAAATTTAPPSTEATTTAKPPTEEAAAAARAAAATPPPPPPPEAAAAVMQRAETIPVQETQPPAHTCDSEAAKHSRSAELLSRYRRLLAENQELRRRQLCRKCCRKAANVTLLPCGHLLYCQDCANALTHCGVCRKEILADVKTYVC